MIKIRNLQEKDVSFMLEWMRDEDTKHIFQKDMSSITLEQALGFIRNSDNCETEGNSLNYAVVDDDDEYLGTISLKNLSFHNSNAEYAISMRKCAQGTGVASVATKLILCKAFNELKLHRVYLNVLATNMRANKFYEKNGFIFEGKTRECLFVNGEYKDLNWYSILESEFKSIHNANN